MNTSPDHESDNLEDRLIQNSPPENRFGDQFRDNTAFPDSSVAPPESTPDYAAEPLPVYPPEPWASDTAREALPSFLHLPAPPPSRIPHFGHLLLLAALASFGVLATGAVMGLAMILHLSGVSTTQRAMSDVHFLLGSEALLYLSTFLFAIFVFPLFWHKSLFAGLQWNGRTALRLRWQLVSAAFLCLLLALADSFIVPEPADTPIEKIFRTPGAAWLLFAFGVTFAPFFEEIFFRGFLLPALCTACDWFAEHTNGEPLRPLAENGHPQWSLSAMVIASIVVSIPFAWMHGEQTGYSIGPFLLLLGVSLVLCAVRLATRSLAASVLVHACYNFSLFSLMFIATGGFRHLDKM